jgi:hypothetical protein
MGVNINVDTRKKYVRRKPCAPTDIAKRRRKKEEGRRKTLTVKRLQLFQLS